MTKENKELLLKDLCTRLPYGVRGRVKADATVPHAYDMNGFPEETTFDVDVELQRIDVNTDEIFVSTFDDNEDLGNYIEECQIEGSPWVIEEFKPYLRSLSSMTEEERDEFEDESNYWLFVNEDGEIFPMGRLTDSDQFECGILSGLKYLLENHFDYHDLISKGLALEAPEGIYN